MNIVGMMTGQIPQGYQGPPGGYSSGVGGPQSQTYGGYQQPTQPQQQQPNTMYNPYNMQGRVELKINISMSACLVLLLL